MLMDGLAGLRARPIASRAVVSQLEEGRADVVNPPTPHGRVARAHREVVRPVRRRMFSAPSYPLREHAVRWADDTEFGRVSHGLALDLRDDALAGTTAFGSEPSCECKCQWCDSVLLPCRFPDVYSTCPTCQLSHVARPRHVPAPRDPAAAWPAGAPPGPTPQHAAASPDACACPLDVRGTVPGPPTRDKALWSVYPAGGGLLPHPRMPCGATHEAVACAGVPQRPGQRCHEGVCGTRPGPPLRDEACGLDYPAGGGSLPHPRMPCGATHEAVACVGDPQRPGRHCHLASTQVMSPGHDPPQTDAVDACVTNHCRSAGADEFRPPAVWQPGGRTTSSSPPTGTTRPPAPASWRRMYEVYRAQQRSEQLLSVEHFRWASLRQAPTDPALVAVCHGSDVLRWESRRAVTFVRHVILSQWQRAVATALTRFNEADVAAFVVALVLSDPTRPLVDETVIPESFAGLDHEFLPFDALSEPGIFRPAAARQGPPLVGFDEYTSAFRSVAGLRAPLDLEAHRRLFAWHPDGPTLCNNIAFGFSTMANLPRGKRWAPPVTSGDEAKHRALMAAVQSELKESAFVEATGEQAARARLAPFMAVPKPNGTFRGVSDLSWGPDSVNVHTHRSPVPRSRLADIERVLLRIRWMKAARPGDPVVLSKFDAARAFRQCAVPWRELLFAAHAVEEGDDNSVELRKLRVFLNTRLTMGGKASGDMMSVGISVIRDYLAAQYGIFAESYIDDMLVVTYASEAAATIARVERLWRALGWPFNEDKFAKEASPATVRTFLGWSIDTERDVVFLDDEHATKLTDAIDAWLSGGVRLDAREYSKLAGRLQFVAKLFPFGRVFLRSLHRHAWTPDRADDVQDKLPGDVRADLEWWRDAIISLNGSASFADTPTGPTLDVYTDASGSGWGCVAHDLRQYACGRWGADQRYCTSTAQWEAFAILAACSLWGRTVSGGVLHVHSDSLACVGFLKSMRAADPHLYFVLRAIALLQLRHRFALKVSHVAGVQNTDADYLSRKIAPPRHCSHYGQCAATPLMQIAGSALRVHKSALGSLEASPMTRLLRTLQSTVLLSGTQSLAALSWTPWKWVTQWQSAGGAYSTFAAGWSITTRTYVVTRCPGTSQPCGRDWARCTGGSSNGPVPCLSGCCASARFPASVSSRCPSIRQSCVQSLRMRLCPSAFGRQSALPGSSSCGCPSTRQPAQQPPGLNMSCYDGMSDRTWRAGVICCTSRIRRVISSIKGRPLFLCRAPVTPRVQSTCCAGTCRRWKRVPATVTPRCSERPSKEIASLTSRARTSTGSSRATPQRVVCHRTSSPLTAFESVQLLN